MPKSARFAATFLSLAVTLAAHGADLRDVKEAARVGDVFPSTARVRLLNVWATWCVPCIAEMPDLRAIDETFGSELAIVGVSLDDAIPDAKRSDVVSFLEKQKISFTNIYFTGLPDKLAEELKFDGALPITIAYDRRGKELWRHQGRLNRNETIANIRELLRRN
jgi:thiol-disulfide isomerase/thioredoxin